MLHRIADLSRELMSGMCLAIFCLVACRRDHAAKGSEEAAYMVDYAPPENKWGFINTEGVQVIKAIYDDAGPFSEGLAAVNKNGKWGYIDGNGNTIIQAIFKSAWAFHEKKARVRPFDQPEQYIDRNGKALLSEEWSAADDFSEGRARVKSGNTFGYIDSSGQLIIPAIYTRGRNFKGGICIVEYQEKLGVIDIEGQTILKPEYTFIKITGNNTVILCRSGNSSIAFNSLGKELAKIPQGIMSDCDGRFISVREKDLMYLFDLSTQKPIHTGTYSNIIYLEESIWAGKTNAGYILLGHEGQPMTSTAYTQINKFSDGLAAYNKGETWGYLDTSGKERTGDIFGLAWDYKEGFARAAFKDGIAFIDKNQQLAFYPPEGTLDMRDFSEGFATIQME